MSNALKNNELHDASSHATNVAASFVLNTIDAPTSTVRRSLLVFALLFFVFSMAFLVFKRTDLFPWVGECYPVEEPDNFMAYCHSVRFGDYEHYAYFHQSEPEAIAHVKQANVLFLGSSNTQFAFSTDAVSRFFTRHESNHYVLGFGHGSQSGVALAVAKKLELDPKVWVVNADPFFTGEVNDTFARIQKLEQANPVIASLPTRLQPTIEGEYARKRRLQTEQQQRCSADANDSTWCVGKVDTLHRNRLNGHWVVDYYRDNLQLPVADDAAAHMNRLDDYVRIAEAFIGELNIERECLIITATPRTATPGAYAKALADRLGAPFVFPELNKLLTIDGFHLDPGSAERWSEAFMAELEPYLDNCR